MNGDLENTVSYGLCVCLAFLYMYLYRNFRDDLSIQFIF